MVDHRLGLGVVQRDVEDGLEHSLADVPNGVGRERLVEGEDVPGGFQSVALQLHVGGGDDVVELVLDGGAVGVQAHPHEEVRASLLGLEVDEVAALVEFA